MDCWCVACVLQIQSKEKFLEKYLAFEVEVVIIQNDLSIDHVVLKISKLIFPTFLAKKLKPLFDENVSKPQKWSTYTKGAKIKIVATFWASIWCIYSKALLLLQGLYKYFFIDGQFTLRVC